MEQLFDHIDAYIWNLLSADERQAFEKQLAADADLRAELALRQLENEAFQLADKTQLRAKMTAWQAEEAAEAVTDKATPQTETKVVSIHKGSALRFTPMRWAAAAALVLLLVVGVRYWATTNYGSDALATEFYAKKGSDAVFYGSNGTATTLDPEALLKQAQAAFEAKNYEQARNSYQTIVATPSVDANFKEEAEWKLLMTLMAAKKTDTASGFDVLLIKITSDSSHKYHKPALELNEKVQSFWWRFAN